MSEAGDHPADVLPLVDEVRLAGAEAGQAAPGIAERECQAEATGAHQALDMQILREAARPNLQALSAAGGQSKLSACVWGLGRVPSVEPAGCWSSRVARSVTNRRRPTRIASSLGKCGGWPSFIRDMPASECMDC
jgi:hypothetical protein